MANLRVNRITSTEVFETTGSVQFDGDGDYLELADSGDWDHKQQFTWETWIYLKSYDTNGALIVEQRSNGGSTGMQWYINTSNVIIFNKNASTNLVTAPNTFTVGVWHHLAVCHDGSTIRIFMDGVIANSVPTSTVPDNVSEPLRIGKVDGYTSYDLNGHLSNLRFVNGTALYTENFTPPIRELEVIPNTVLLACQHKTDASHEKTGKTITVNGDAVANELTPGLLTSVVKSGGSSAITGSVEFDGTGDYLSLSSSSDFAFGTGDFTVEGFINRSTLAETDNVIDCRNGSSGGWKVQIESDGDISFYSEVSSGYPLGSDMFRTIAHEWYHFAFTRSGGTLFGFMNGVLITSASHTSNYSTSIPCIIGARYSEDEQYHKGFISNFRIIKGTALYTQDFIPPTSKLKNLPGTVLLCCQDNESVTTEATGKTITANGDPTATRFTPSVGSDGSVEFAGPTTINTENYFYLPTGNTESRTGGAGGGDRGIFSGGHSPTNTIDFITISTTGNSQDFGDLTYTPFYGASCASSTRGLHAGGATPTIVNTINYLTIMTMGNAFDFGDLTRVSRDFNAFSSQTRGVFAGGITPTEIDTIDFVTIATTSNAIDFGNLSGTRQQVSGSSSPTRGIISGGVVSPAAVNTIEYVTIASTGDAVDFGDLATSTWALTAAASQTRSIIAGGAINPGGGTTATNTASYITIASTGNANDFGDLTVGRFQLTGVSNSTRGAFAGGYIPSPTSANQDTIDFVTIASTGNASDFGNLHGGARREMGGCSNGHGGLG
jgi:hypothetical protein